MRRIAEIGGKRLPVLRWSFLRMLIALRQMTTTWQVGDGREAALADYVVANAKPGDVHDAIRAVDDFCYGRSFMMNVGDEKGALLDAAIGRVQPDRLLELGTYCGYSALRTVRAMPERARLYSIEFNADNAAIARRVLQHAGVPEERVTVVVGTLGDGGRTIATLENEHGFEEGSVDFVFLDHDKDAYLTDLELIVGRGWLREGGVVVADNVKFPGVPGYREHMREHQDRWRTTEHETHVEYQTLIKDLVLESEYLGAGPDS